MSASIDPGRKSRAILVLTIVAIALWVAWTLPLALEERTLTLRDVLRTHAPYKAFGARALAAGEIPAIDPEWGMGQPFAGNPSTLAFYPGNLLYLALPFWSAFHLHFALHWLLGFFGMRALARALGQSDGAALLAALTWSASGYVLSTLSFYNLIGVAAWAPEGGSLAEAEGGGVKVPFSTISSTCAPSNVSNSSNFCAIISSLSRFVSIRCFARA